MLRYVEPGAVLPAHRDRATPSSRGVPIAAGDKVTIWYGAANRDEEVFTDPQSFDVGRTPNEHLAFGGRGPHFCLGASLAKMEIRVMFEEILGRLPDMALAGEPERLAVEPHRGHQAPAGAVHARARESRRRALAAEEEARRARELVLRVVGVLAAGGERR